MTGKEFAEKAQQLSSEQYKELLKYLHELTVETDENKNKDSKPQ